MRHQSTSSRCIVNGAANPNADNLSLEEYIMHRANRYVASLILTAALVAPLSILAIPRPQDADAKNKVYDKQHKDYHNWDDNENRAWGQYQTDNKKTPQEFSKAKPKEQAQYWNWRHAHPDKN
jgi:hypothetical protein